MRFKDFLKEKVWNILLILFAVFTIQVFLIPSQIHIFIKSYIVVSILGTYFIILLIEYIKKKSFYEELLKRLQGLDKKYLIKELLQEPNFIEGKILEEVLEETNKAMIENVNKFKFANNEYKEYIELWIHEIKMPIATSKMIIENNKNDVTNNIEEEIEEIENYIEQALFYARSNHVEKDYLIKEVDLKHVVNSVVMKNKKNLIQNKIKIDIHDIEGKIYSDSKWLLFILNQIIVNSIKYARDDEPSIEMYKEEYKEYVVLYLKDNGIGIRSEELPKVFDKGFTGENGRNKTKSTGIGLYLCKKLCDKLGHSINITSKYGEGTTVRIIFPKGSFSKM